MQKILKTMSLWKAIVAAVVAIQLTAAQENCPGLRLSTGLGALLGDVPLSSSLPTLPPLPTVDSYGTPDLALPTLPSLASGDCLPAPPPLAYQPTLPAPLPLIAPLEPPCPCVQRFRRKARCACKEPLLPAYPYPNSIDPCLPAPILPQSVLDPFPLKPKCGCPPKKCLSSLLGKILLKKGLSFGLGPDCGPDVALLPDAVSAFAVDALAQPLAAGIADDCVY